MKREAISLFTLAALGLPFGLAGNAYGDSPSAAQALAYKPIQGDVEYERPEQDDVKKCSIRAEKIDGETAWVVRGPENQLLRKFSDTNGDNVVDRWSYYQGELEVYRDIDANFNGKADQYRWFHTGGTRWGVDKNEDGEIDTWRTISAEEVAQELVAAVKESDADRFRALLLTSDEIKDLKLGDEQAKEIGQRVIDAVDEFKKLVADQKAVSKETKFLSFGGAHPGLVPAGLNGAGRDLMVYENAAALIDVKGESRQINIGTLIRVDDTWKIFSAPRLEQENNVTEGGYFFRTTVRRGGDHVAAAASGPSEEVQKMMAELEKLDQQIATATPEQQASLNEKRCDLLEGLASSAKSQIDREQWVRQMADTVSAAAQSGTFDNGVKRLQSLEGRLGKSKDAEDLVAYVKFRRMSAEYALKLQSPKADFAKIQDEWLEQLEDFVKAHPKSPDSADAMLQLAVAHEFAGDEDDAKKWYGRIVDEFSSSPAAAKAAGAKRRLASVGNVISLRGETVFGQKIDLAQFRGRTVLIQYWATWCEPCLSDMDELKELQSKYAKSFAVLGVNLDSDAADAKKFAADERLPWHNLHESGGLESRLANELGILTLPTMILIDEKGRVLNRNIQVGELSAELRKMNLAEKKSPSRRRTR